MTYATTCAVHDLSSGLPDPIEPVLPEPEVDSGHVYGPTWRLVNTAVVVDATTQRYSAILYWTWELQQ